MKNLNKKDLLFSLIIGEIAAVLLFLIGRNLAGETAGLAIASGYLWHLFYVFPILCAAGLIAADVLSRVFAPLFQFAKFVLVGGMNFLVDLGVLNLLVIITGIAAGAWQSVFKGISFVVAVVNSYYWNKGWVFSENQNAKIKMQNIGSSEINADVANEGRAKNSKQFLQFFVVSVVGFLINVAVNYAVVNWLVPTGGVGAKTWANVGAAAAAIAAMMWNFIGYKVFVFKSE